MIVPFGHKNNHRALPQLVDSQELYHSSLKDAAIPSAGNMIVAFDHTVKNNHRALPQLVDSQGLYHSSLKDAAIPSAVHMIIPFDQKLTIPSVRAYHLPERDRG